MDIQGHLDDIQKLFTRESERNLNLYHIGHYHNVRFGLVCPDADATMQIDQGGKWIMVNRRLGAGEQRVAIMYFLAVYLLTNEYKGRMDSIQQLYAPSYYWTPVQRAATELMLHALMPDSRFLNTELSERQQAARFAVPVEIVVMRRKLAAGTL